jgi:hypothetical protein
LTLRDTDFLDHKCGDVSGCAVQASAAIVAMEGCSIARISVFADILGGPIGAAVSVKEGLTNISKCLFEDNVSLGGAGALSIGVGEWLGGGGCC